MIKGFTQKYNVDELVYFEIVQNPESAIVREKQVKDLRRSKKLALIHTINPEMTDLYDSIL